MGKNINNKVKYRLIVAQEKNNRSSRKFPWKGINVDDPELRKEYCFWFNQISPNNGLSKKINGSKLKDDIEVIGVGVQVSHYKDELGNRKWEDYDYDPYLSEPIRYNSSM
jgi:hypothetical protein